MWGTDFDMSKNETPVRIIPTRVGNSRPEASRPGQLPDHPHACGEQVSGATRKRYRCGSSPRVWGTGGVDCQRLEALRIIPTRVGNRPRLYPSDIVPPDHPHACGEQNSNYNASYMTTGSSPRVWGTVFSACRPSWCLRIIPTRVGNSTCWGPAAAPRADHPHACGEQ